MCRHFRWPRLVPFIPLIKLNILTRFHKTITFIFKYYEERLKAVKLTVTPCGNSVRSCVVCYLGRVRDMFTVLCLNRILGHLSRKRVVLSEELTEFEVRILRK